MLLIVRFRNIIHLRYVLIFFLVACECFWLKFGFAIQIDILLFDLVDKDPEINDLAALSRLFAVKNDLMWCA